MSIGPLVHWSIGPLVHWSLTTIGLLVHGTIGPLVNHSISPLVHWSIGPNVNKDKLLSERTSGVPPVIFTSVMTSLSLLVSLDSLDLLGSLVSLDSLSSLYLQIERPLTFLLSLLSSLSIGDRYFRVRFQNSWNVRSFDQCCTSSDCQSPTRSDLRCCSGPDI